MLPGPEAHELCVYFGMLARGRVGGILAGLGFMLPGFVLMFALSWFYVTTGAASAVFAAVFQGMQPAVGALIVRAVHRIGQHALTDHWLWGIAIVAGFAQLLAMNFLITLPLSGIAYVLCRRGRPGLAAGLGVALLTAALALAINPASIPATTASNAPTSTSPSLLALFGSGLRSGLLTFGGAYTVIPFLQNDAVVAAGWMTNAQFLDGLALSGILPAPLIIFATFVGYVGGGPWGAVALTVGIFLPAFAFTLIGHDYLERTIGNPSLHRFLDGVTAGVVGLIAVTTLGLLRTAISDVAGLGIFAAALLVLSRWKAKAAVAVVMLGAGLLGLLQF